MIFHYNRVHAFLNMDIDDYQCQSEKLGRGHYKITILSPDKYPPIPIFTIVQRFNVRDDIKVSVVEGTMTNESFEMMIHEGDNGTAADTLRDASVIVSLI